VSTLRVDFEPRTGYLYASVSGEYVLAHAQAAYRNVLQAASRERLTRVLIDCTRITGTATVEERLQFGVFMADEQVRASESLQELLSWLGV
jgi:hypothetical protein